MPYNDILQNLPALFGSLFTAILFVQSGIDKVVDRKGNMEWLTGHFSKTFLSSFVSLMLTQLTLLELAVGVLNATGIIYFFVTGSMIVIFYASVLGALTITGLFFGQRVAKDYPGAAVLVPYFILQIIMIYLTTPALVK